MSFGEHGLNSRVKLTCQYTVYSVRRNRICYKRINTGRVDRGDGVKGAWTGKKAALYEKLNIDLPATKHCDMTKLNPKQIYIYPAQATKPPPHIHPHP